MLNRSEVQKIKEMYPSGTKIRLIHMADIQPVEPNTTGIVQTVDDIGTIHMVWDNGRQLGLVVGEDQFEILSTTRQLNYRACKSAK